MQPVALAAIPTVSYSMAAMPIVRTDLDKAVNFIVVGSRGFSELRE
jgi:hypothetical protein